MPDWYEECIQTMRNVLLFPHQVFAKKQITEAATGGVLVKKLFKNFAILKRDSNAGVFLWILQKC